MQNKKKLLQSAFFVLTFFILHSSFFIPQAHACNDISCNKDDTDAYLDCIKEKQSCWEGKINETRSQQITLANTISILDNQIYVQELEIDKIEAEIEILQNEIDDLTERLSGLEVSLDELSRILVRRVQEDYKRQRYSNFQLSIISESLNEIVSQLKYLQKTKEHTLELLEKTEIQRADYDQQKQLKEEREAEEAAKQAQLAAQKTELDSQKRDQELLLVETKHSEARYQEELAKTLAELQAIQSIIAGKGDETSVRDVEEGENIASIISGASACSTGTHLHFEVVKDGAHRNPADYLKPVDIVWSNSPDGTFGFSGAWSWPVNDAARITQGYGMTWYASVMRAYGGSPHTGIDLVSKTSSNLGIKAVKPGKLYRGSIPCGGGLLRYVKVEHKEGGESTYYLHINY